MLYFSDEFTQLLEPFTLILDIWSQWVQTISHTRVDIADMLFT